MEVEDKITINKAYASKYEKKKRAEELSKLRDKYGDAGLEESESSSSGDEEEDENAEMLTADVEKDFLRTLSLIHSRDPRIYEKDTQFFQKDVSKTEKKKTKEDENKPMYLKDYERKQLIERGVMAGVSDSEEEEEDTNNKEKLSRGTYLEEQEQLKAEFQQAAEEEDDDDGKDSLLTLRQKEKEEIEEEERDYILWLKGEKEKMDAGEGDFSGLRTVWTAPDLDSGEAFLRDYILNRRFIDRDNFESHVPTYDDIVGDSDGSEERVKEKVDERREEAVDVSEDEASLDRQEDFERSYNFRFEEPGGDQITTYPRTVSGSVRREDDRRKEKRKLRDERREREKEQKEEELKRLKKLKRKEIKQKLEKIKNITGNPNVGFSMADLDGDFDPVSYDEAMGRAFDDDYYVMKEGEGEEEENEKPIFSDDNEVYDNWDEWEPEDELHCEDPNFNMDAEYDPATEKTASNKSSSKSLKHRHKLAQAVSVKKPHFDPEEKTFEEYFNQYYGLDYEDIVGDMLCRFKYNQVPANTFGLTTEEVLACEDKELNQWASLKKAVQIRTEEEEEKDKRLYKKKARNFKRKYHILASLKEPQEESQDGRRKSRKLKSSRTSRTQPELETHSPSSDITHDDVETKETSAEDNSEDHMVDDTTTSSSEQQLRVTKNKKRARKMLTESMTASDLPFSTAKKQKHRKKHNSAAAKKISSARLKSYGLK